jgi:hypothetical protein
MRTVPQDLPFAWRMLSKDRGFTALVVLTRRRHWVVRIRLHPQEQAVRKADLASASHLPAVTGAIAQQGGFPAVRSDFDVPDL